jgi:tellurite methyltransferase
MSEQDRQKWDSRYAQESAPEKPSRLLLELADYLPNEGHALDLAGGAGRHAIWLAQRGLDVTLADISPVGLDLAAKRAEAAGVSINTQVVDLEGDEFPAGPWDLIVSFHYLWRPLFAFFPRVLSEGGILILAQPTLRNLQRHAKPPTRFLLDEGELPTLVEALTVLHYEEGWSSEDRHDAVIVCQRTSRDPSTSGFLA